MIGLDGAVVNKKDENDPYGLSVKKPTVAQAQNSNFQQGNQQSKSNSDSNTPISKATEGNGQTKQNTPKMENLIRTNIRQNNNSNGDHFFENDGFLQENGGNNQRAPTNQARKSISQQDQNLRGKKVVQSAVSR